MFNSTSTVITSLIFITKIANIIYFFETKVLRVELSTDIAITLTITVKGKFLLRSYKDSHFRTERKCSLV